jgi:predicted hydrolase (HD superfamily)
MEKRQALDLARQHVKKESNLKHMIAVGGIMRELAIHLGQDAQDWEAVGILHDIDFESCTGPEDHTLVAQKILCDHLDQALIEAIMAHNHEHTGVAVDNDLKRGLICSDAASGLIVAATLVLPSKRIVDVNTRSLMKKYNSKDFAKGVSRERIALCEELGLSLEEFLGIALTGMVGIAEEIGL